MVHRAVAPDLDNAACRQVSAQFDLARGSAYRYPSAADAKAAGATAQAYAAGIGARFVLSAPHAFKVNDPDTLLYTGTADSSQLAGIEWNVPSSTAPAGFVGDHDTWTESSEGVWTLRVWIIRPFENQVNVFASSHPCLPADGPVFGFRMACYTATHPEPLRILVSNDDGFDALGIDAVVEALRDAARCDRDGRRAGHQPERRRRADHRRAPHGDVRADPERLSGDRGPGLPRRFDHLRDP